MSEKKIAYLPNVGLYGVCRELGACDPRACGLCAQIKKDNSDSISRSTTKKLGRPRGLGEPTLLQQRNANVSEMREAGVPTAEVIAWLERKYIDRQFTPKNVRIMAASHRERVNRLSVRAE